MIGRRSPIWFGRRAAFFLAVLLTCLAGAPVRAAELSGIQRGTLTSTGNGTVTVDLPTAVDPARTVLFFHTRHDDNEPADSMVRGTLLNGSTLAFTRVTNGSGDIDIVWSLAEFASGVQVQRGEFDQTRTTMTVDLATPVASTAQAFVLWSKTSQAGDSSWDADNPVGGYLLNTSQLRFSAGNDNDSHVIAYQVVEFTDPADILVQSGDSPGMNGGNDQRNINLGTNIDTSRSFLLAGYTTDDSGSDVGERMMRGEFVDANTIRFSRQATGDRIDRIQWQVVELRDGSRVLHGIEDFAPGQAVRTVSLPEPVDTARSVAFSGVQPVGGLNMGSSAYRGDDVIGVGSFTFELTGASSLEVRRNNAADDASVGWFVVEFNGAAAPPPGPVLEVHMDETQWTGSSGEVIDSAGGNNGTARNGINTAGADPAVPGNPGTCRYGEFDGVDDLLEFADAPHLDLPGELTVAIWIYARRIPGSGLKSIVSKDTNYEFHVTSGSRINWWWNDANGATRQFDSTATITPNAWHHVAITYRSGSQVIYVDGVPSGSRSYTGNLITNNLPLQIGQDQGFAGREWDGYLDELRVYGQALDAAQVQALMNETQPCGLKPVGEWHFDEYGWNGTADEVIDYSGNDHHGTAFSSVTDVGLLCNAANLRADGTSDYLSLDAAALDGLDDFTVLTWYRGVQTSTAAILSGARAGQANELLFWMTRPDRFDPWLLGNQGANVDTTEFNDGNWHLLAWTREGASNCLYVDDVLQDCANRGTGPVSIDAGGFIVGQEQDSLGGGFDPDQDAEADLDELLVFDSALSPAQIAVIRANNLAGLNWDGTPRVCPITGATALVIGHDNAGIHCLDEPVSVTAVDAAGNQMTSFGSEITLTTSTGRGSWTLVSGAGVLSDPTPDDGTATYVYAPADNGSATFALSYREGAPLVDVDAYQTSDPSVADDDSEGLLAFAASGFTLTAGALPNPPPSPLSDPVGTQTAGTDFPVHLAAYGVTADDPVCGVIESYAGPRNLTFTQNYLDPGSGSRVASVDGLAANSGIAQPVTFTAGQAVVTVKYKDAGQIRLSAEDATSFPAPVAGATGPFVVRPAALVMSRVESAAGTPNPGAVSVTGPGFVPAGEAFVVDVEARDAEGDLTPNFGREATPERVRVTSLGLQVPAGGRNGSLGDVSNGAAFSAAAVPGRFHNDSVLFDEVGIIDLGAELLDGDYLGTGPLAGPSGNVGRFYPAAFELAFAVLSDGCGTFTYMDQPALALDYRLQALNSLGAVTQNYDGALLGGGAVASLAYVAENADDGVDRSGRLSAVVGTWRSGEVLVSQPDLSFARLAAPDGPFESLQLGLVVTDPLDPVALAGLDMNALTSGDCVAAGSCSAQSLGTPARLRFGRLAVLPAYGPEDLDLAVGLQAEWFDGAAFAPNSDDGCSVYTGAAAALSGFAGNLDSGETVVTGPLTSASLLAGGADPDLPLLLSAPGFGNEGAVDVALDVAPWLEFDWSGSGTQDPTGTATFGRYRGHDRIIFWSEQR
ncbi:MAG: LamG domain-containing protein [Pseudomonadales bacterium]